MRFLSFKIKDFKGIKATEIELAQGNPGRVITLIGLNESGKTTILEAVSNFLSSDSDTQSFVETLYAKVDAKTLIPKDRKGRFTERISVKAIVRLDASDIEAVRVALLTDLNVKLDISSLASPIHVEKGFNFSDSKLESQMKYWTIEFSYTKGTSRKVHSFKPGSGTTPEWHKVVDTLNARLPSVLYFPTFLFDIPDRIYISPSLNETVINSYYRKVFSSVLRTIDPDYSVDKHILDRVKSLIASSGPSSVGNSEKSDDIDTVFRDASNEISRVIIGAWKDILDKDVINLRVELKWGIDTNKSNDVYIEPYIVERQQYKYLLKERSLGFRWFFSFLLFTQFRRQSSLNGTVFLFDEPASNLHSAAQTELLNSFKKIMGDKDYIIYSTHSHYMINPLWLEKAYIVNNSAVDLEDSIISSFGPTPNDIKAIKYKRFVVDNPSRTTYFQPALDALKLRFSPMEIKGKAIILEGKFDYYPFQYLRNYVESDEETRCFAAQGAGEMAILISLFRGFGIPFVIILDADKQGKIEKTRYIRDYHLKDAEGFTLDQADISLDGKSFESLYKDDIRNLIIEKGLVTGNLKAEGAALFQMLLSNDETRRDIDETVAAFKLVYNFAAECLAAQIKSKQ